MNSLIERLNLTGKTIDLTPKIWGHNYQILAIEDEGQKLRLAVWCTPSPRKGDLLILRNGEGTTRYRVRKVERGCNVPDMTFADVEFMPRKQA